jgi:hypothetical protein
MREGLEKNQHERVMRRYCLEKWGHSRWHFIAGQLSASNFAQWADHV